MKKVISSEKRPIKLWLDDIEEGALDQAKNLANLPFVLKHIAIMPDSHQGYGMPIGGVMATDGVVVPNAVGVDIGCGMCAVKTSLQVEDLPIETLKKIMGEIRKAVPVGFNKHKKAQDESLMPYINSKIFGNIKVEKLNKENELDKFVYSEYPVIFKEYSNALKSLGTLGGGNHFIEIQKDEDNYIWIMIHSGSRNLGFKVADYYNELAYDLNIKWQSDTYLPKNKKDSLAFLPVDSDEGQLYIREMNYCVEFALANRKLMMERIKEIFIGFFSKPMGTLGLEINIDFKEMINIAHNYASLEKHFGKNVMVHRKGATLARKGTVGIIPGSQGTKSYIVEGLGNKESFESCSHGAGRKMGRKQAEKELNLEEEIRILEDQGIIHAIRGKSDLDEASGAYKNIDKVMKNQEDLIDIIKELSPLAVIKG